MRDWLNEHARLVVPCIILFVAFWVLIAVVRIRHAARPDRPEPMAFFYDQNKRKLFEVKAATEGPIETDSGPYKGEPAGVRARVFACGDCSVNDHFIGWLEKPAPEVLEARRQGLPPPPEGEFKLMIRTPDSDEWVLSESPAGAAIFRAINNHCPQGQRAYPCRPKAKRDD